MRNNGDICNIKQCTFELLHSLPYYGYCNILSSFIGLLSFYDSPKFVAFFLRYSINWLLVVLEKWKKIKDRRNIKICKSCKIPNVRRLPVNMFKREVEKSKKAWRKSVKKSQRKSSGDNQNSRRSQKFRKIYWNSSEELFCRTRVNFDLKISNFYYGIYDQFVGWIFHEPLGNIV